MKKNIIIVFSLFLIFSCRKVTREEIFEEALSQLKLGCKGLGADDSLYVKALIGLDSFCMSDGGGYQLLGELSNCLRTPSNTINLSDTTAICGRFLSMSFLNPYNAANPNEDVLKPFLRIEAPIENKNISYLTHCEKYLQKGSYPIRDITKSENEGYAISLHFSYKLPNEDNYGAFSITSSRGSQAKDDQLIIEEVQKWRGRGGMHYWVKGRFKCKLYSSLNTIAVGKLSKIVENAQFVQKFIVPF